MEKTAVSGQYQNEVKMKKLVILPLMTLGLSLNAFSWVCTDNAGSSIEVKEYTDVGYVEYINAKATFVGPVVDYIFNDVDKLVERYASSDQREDEVSATADSISFISQGYQKYSNRFYDSRSDGTLLYEVHKDGNGVKLLRYGKNWFFNFCEK